MERGKKRKCDGERRSEKRRFHEESVREFI